MCVNGDVFKHVKAVFLSIALLFSVVHNFKHDKQSTQEPFSELKQNISFVNHLLQDLLQKYGQLKQIANNKDNTDHKLNTNVDEFFNGDAKLRLRAKVKLSKAGATVGSTSFQTDKLLDISGSEANNKKQTAKDLSDDDYSLSADSIDSQEETSLTKLFKGFRSHEKHLKKNVKNKIVSVKNDHLSKGVRSNPKAVKDPEDVEKVLVIHLGSTKKTKVKKNRASSPTPVEFSPSTSNKMPTPNSILFKPEKRQHDSDLEEEQAMQKAMLRAKQLREAYGKACSQVVARKCQNALKTVLKDVCKSDRKCSDEFNDDFTNNGVSACNKEFKQSVKNRGRHVDYQISGDDDYVNNHHRPSSELSKTQFVDYTREGELDMTCLQALSNVKEPIEVRTKSEKSNLKPKDANLLRDRYEKACKQVSYTKCITACKSTSDNTCKKFDCIKDKVKALKWSCKRRCKESNKVRGGDSSNSSSSASGSSSGSSD